MALSILWCFWFLVVVFLTVSGQRCEDISCPKGCQSVTCKKDRCTRCKDNKPLEILNRHQHSSGCIVSDVCTPEARLVFVDDTTTIVCQCDTSRNYSGDNQLDCKKHFCSPPRLLVYTGQCVCPENQEEKNGLCVERKTTLSSIELSTMNTTEASTKTAESREVKNIPNTDLALKIGVPIGGATVIAIIGVIIYCKCRLKREKSPTKFDGADESCLSQSQSSGSASSLGASGSDSTDNSGVPISDNDKQVQQVIIQNLYYQHGDNNAMDC